MASHVTPKWPACRVASSSEHGPQNSKRGQPGARAGLADRTNSHSAVSGVGTWPPPTPLVCRKPARRRPHDVKARGLEPVSMATQSELPCGIDDLTQLTPLDEDTGKRGRLGEEVRSELRWGCCCLRRAPPAGRCCLLVPYFSIPAASHRTPCCPCCPADYHCGATRPQSSRPSSQDCSTGCRTPTAGAHSSPSTRNGSRRPKPATPTRGCTWKHPTTANCRRMCSGSPRAHEDCSAVLGRGVRSTK